MSKRRRHSNEFKLQVVTEYEEEKGGYKHLAEKHKIPPSLVQKWVNQYREFGTEGLFRSRTYRKYSLEFKLKALKMHETSEKSYVEIANELRMKNSSHIAQWKMQYQNEGIAGLSKKRGRPKMSENEKPPNRNKAANNLLVDEKDKRIKELEYEVRLLKIKMNTWNYSGVWGKKKRRKNKNHPQTPRLIQTDRDSCRYRRIDAKLRKRGIIIMSICLNYHEAIIK